MKIILAIGLGSGLGGILRFLISQLITNKHVSSFPFGTLAVNLLGCLLIGVVYGLAMKGAITTEWKLFLGVGILGGFTTFSAFSFETMELIKQNNLLYALIYMGISVAGGVCATFLGFMLNTART